MVCKTRVEWPSSGLLSRFQVVLTFQGYSRGRPNHDHDHFRVHLAGPHFSFLGYPRIPHQMPLLHSGTQRNHKDFSSDVPSNAIFQKAADVWKKDVWDFHAFSQTFLELRFSLENEGKDRKNLNSQTWPGTPRRPSHRHPRPPEFFVWHQMQNVFG